MSLARIDSINSDCEYCDGLGINYLVLSTYLHTFSGRVMVTVSIIVVDAILIALRIL